MEADSTRQAMNEIIHDTMASLAGAVPAGSPVHFEFEFSRGGKFSFTCPQPYTEEGARQYETERARQKN